MELQADSGPAAEGAQRLGGLREGGRSTEPILPQAAHWLHEANPATRGAQQRWLGPGLLLLRTEGFCFTV